MFTRDKFDKAGMGGDSMLLADWGSACWEDECTPDFFAYGEPYVCLIDK